MKNQLILLALVYLATLAAGYANDSITDEYSKLVNGEPIYAIMDANENAWGDWWYLLIVGAPWLGMVFYQKSTNLATIWLTIMLAAYGNYFTSVPSHIFYLLAVLWVASVLMKLLSTNYSN